jgi:hypothetical protein
MHMNVATDQDPTIDTPSVALIKGQDWRGRAGHADNRVSIDRLVGIHAQLAALPCLAVQSP